MAANTNPTDLTSLGADGYVSAEDVLFLRRNVFADGIVSAAELDALFALGERAGDGDRVWPQFFAEAAADYYLREEEPNGYLSQDEFNSLKARITRDADKASALELGLLIKLLETAISSPPEMSAFIGEQLNRHIVEKADGPRIDANDVDLIRRFIFACGGDGNVAVTRDEAELLFDLSDACANARNDPSWNDFFKKAVTNHLMAHIGFSPMGRAEALGAHDAIANDRRGGSSEGGIFARIATLLSSPAKKVDERHRAANEAREIASAQAEKITGEEADWLADRIGRDGTLHPSERDLVAYMRELEAELPPKLKALVDRAA